MTQTNLPVPNKPMCAVGGMLEGGRAMCGYIIVGGRKFCGLPAEKATCEHQINWGGFEADCACRDLTYSDYVHHHGVQKITTNVVSESAYKRLNLVIAEAISRSQHET